MVDTEQLAKQLEELQKQLQDDLLEETAADLKVRPSLRTAPDKRSVQALAAVYTLQKYLPRLRQE